MNTNDVSLQANYDLIENALYAEGCEIDVDEEIDNDSIGYTEVGSYGEIDAQPDYLRGYLTITLNLKYDSVLANLIENDLTLWSNIIYPYIEYIASNENIHLLEIDFYKKKAVDFKNNLQLVLEYTSIPEMDY